MKKIPLFFLALAGPILFLSNLDGALPQNTGAPGDLTCGRSVCHNVPANVGNAEMSVVFNNNESFYYADSTYLLTVKIVNPQTMRNGFQILALNQTLQNAGTWQLLEPDKMKIIPGIGFPNRKYVTHKAAGNLQAEWTLAWKAPSSNVGKVTFYASVNSTNNNGQLTGDEVYTSSVAVDYAEVSATAETTKSWFKVKPTLATDAFQVELPDEARAVNLALFDCTGAMVLEQDVAQGGMHTISVADLSPGLYFLKIAYGGQVAVERIMVHK